MEKLKKFGYAALSLVVLFIAAAFGNGFGTFFGKEVSEEFIKDNDPNFNQTLVKISSETNKQLPIMVDSDTRLDSTMSVGDKFYYKYTLVNFKLEDLDVEQIKQVMAPNIRNSACSVPELETFRNNGVKMIYNYHDMNGDFVMQIEVETSTCSRE
jgi:hypothetical protein